MTNNATTIVWLTLPLLCRHVIGWMEHVHSDAGTRITAHGVTNDVTISVMGHFVNEMVFALLDVHF